MKIARARIALAVLLLAAAVAAQEPLAGPLPPELAPEVLAEGRTGAGNLEAEEQTEALDLYDEVDAQLVLAEQWASQAKDTLRQRQAAPASLMELAAALAEPADETPAAVPPDASVDELDLRVRQAEADLVARQQELQQLDDQQRQRETHQPQLPTLITEAKSRLSQLEGELEGTPPEGEHPTITAARRAARLARMRALQNEIAAHDAQLSDPTLWGELLGSRRELAAREVVAAERAVKAWRDALNRRRTQEAEAAARAAKEEVARVLDNELVQSIAADNATDATTRTELAAQIQQTTRKNERAAALLTELRADFDSTKSKVKAVGPTPSIANLLVNRLRWLDASDSDVRQYRRDVARRADEMSSILLARFETEEKLESLVDPATEAERRVAKAGPELGTDSPEEIQEAVHEQLVRRREQLDKLMSDYVTLIEQLETLDLNQTRLIGLTGEYRAFINKRILWVRTAPPIWNDPGLWTNTTSAVTWLLDPEDWRGVATRFGLEMIVQPNVAPSVFLLMVLLLLRRRARRGLDDTAALVSRIRTDSFIHTLRALALTLLVAIPLPLTMWVGGGLLAHCADSGPARAVAQGLRDTALIFFVLQFVHVVCRPQGLADAHFRWPERDLQLMRRHLRWVMPVVLPLLVVLSAVMFDRQEQRVSSLGRLTDIASEVATAIFFFCVLRPKAGVLTSTMQRHPGGWVSRFRMAWFPLLVGLPLVIAFMAILGYLYTAGELDLRVDQSILLVLGLSVANALALRWLFVARRNLVLQQYRRRREALLAAAEEERADESGEGRPAAATVSDEPEAEEIDLPAVSAQTQRLLVFTITISMLAGLLFIWAPALPALSALDDGEYKLWDRSIETEEKITDPVTGVERRYLSKGLVPVTPVDVIRAIVYLIFTIVATRNLPGLIEIVVLQRLPMQRAGRYAITTITRYVFAVLGIGLVFNSLGIGWAKVQWLAAAVSVGLGFGLQEIFANFVSGLIILFERPIRVGDTVTVGDVTGTVARIQMRATTIVTWDRTELVVPNKEFVTSQLVNWTLSDPVLRVILRVGIAYGSDIEKAERILKEIVRDEPDILDEPLPRIIFTAFGDSTLDFEVRCYVDDPDLYRRIAHKVNKEIDRRFRLEGVEIAFPQRDLHLRTADVPLTILRREGGGWMEADDPRPS